MAGPASGAQALGALGDRRALEPLHAILDDEKWRVRHAVAQALGALGDVRAVEPLLASLAGRDIDARRAAARALGVLGGARAIELRLVALADRDIDTVSAAAAALGSLGDLRAVKPLIRSLKSAYWQVPQAAARATTQWRLDDRSAAYGISEIAAKAACTLAGMSPAVFGHELVTFNGRRGVGLR
jgi:HEAT repeat protein